MKNSVIVLSILLSVTKIDGFAAINRSPKKEIDFTLDSVAHSIKRPFQESFSMPVDFYLLIGADSLREVRNDRFLLAKTKEIFKENKRFMKLVMGQKSLDKGYSCHFNSSVGQTIDLYVKHTGVSKAIYVLGTSSFFMFPNDFRHNGSEIMLLKFAKLYREH